MHPVKFGCVKAITLFAAMAMPVWTAAQDNPSQQQHNTYQLIDIGTFGGPASYINDAMALGSPNQINDRGTTVGAAATSIPSPPNSNFTICGGLTGSLQVVFHAFKLEDGIVTDLGTLPGPDNCSVATSINADGEIAGYSENGMVDPLTGIREIRAVVWKHDEIQDIGTFGGNHSVVANINDRGQVAGEAMNTIPDPFSFYYGLLGSTNGTQTRAFLWKNGQKQDLGTLGGPDAAAFFVNEHKQVVGASYTNYIPNPTTGFPTVDPFLWERGIMTDLGTLGGTFGSASPMNNRGQIIGTSNLAGDLTFHPFLWTKAGGMQDLGTLGGSTGTAVGINDDGEVAGTADLVSGHDAFLWEDGVMTDLGNLGKTSGTHAIGSEGQVVGASRIGAPGDARAFLWENGGPMVDLNALIPANSSLTLVFAETINEQGEIAGNGVPAGCAPKDVATCGHAFLLIPNGDCDDDCEGRIVASQNRVVQYPAAMKQGTDSPAETVNNLRNLLKQRYHIPGQPVAPRD